MAGTNLSSIMEKKPLGRHKTCNYFVYWILNFLSIQNVCLWKLENENDMVSFCLPSLKS